MNQRKPDTRRCIFVLIEWYVCISKRRNPPSIVHGPSGGIGATALSLIRISLLRLDGCRVESRPMWWPAVFGIRLGTVVRTWRMACMITLFSMRIRSVRSWTVSVLEAARFMKYLIGSWQRSDAKLSIETLRTSQPTRHLNNLRLAAGTIAV